MTRAELEQELLLLRGRVNALEEGYEKLDWLGAPPIEGPRVLLIPRGCGIRREHIYGLYRRDPERWTGVQVLEFNDVVGPPFWVPAGSIVGTPQDVAIPPPVK